MNIIMSPNHHETPNSSPSAAHSSSATPRISQQDDLASIYSISTIQSNPPHGHHHTIVESPSHLPQTHDAPIQNYSTCVEIPDEVYDHFSPFRKLIIVAFLSYCGFLAPISSTAVLSAVPEVASTYKSTGTVINISNACYMVFMGFSPCFWGPLSQVYGRRIICLTTAILFFAASLGTALSPNLPSYFIFRILTAFQGTSFLTIGPCCIGDIYRPVERATAMGWFLSGTLIGPAFGPFIGGIIVTFKSWRVIFYLQTALAGIAVIGAWFLLPETSHHMKCDDLKGLSKREKGKVLWGMLNPWRVLRLYKYPNLIMVALASSSLVWNMYSLLTPIRYVLNPRFNLNSPIQSGLFYLAPGCGYIFGTFFGGRYADHIVKKWIVKRGGKRIPEDRLRSALPFMGIVIPTCMLVYGWSVEKRFGGIPLPAIMMFCQGVAQLFCFPSLNTYCLDVMQEHSGEVIAGNYMIRYLFAAVGTAVCLPAVEKIGVGWFSTVSAGFLVVSSLASAGAVRWGGKWRDNVDRRERERGGEGKEIEIEMERKGVEKVFVDVGEKEKDIV